jgi:hypothetical protein
MVLSAKRCLLAALVCMVVSGLFSLEPLPFCNPFLIGVSGLTTLTDDASASAINPAAGESGISSSTSFLHGMIALNQYELSSILNYRNSSFIAAWQALDNDDYTRQDFRLGARYDLLPVRFGMGLKLFYDDIPGYCSERDYRLYEGVRARFKKTVADLAFEHKIPPFGGGDKDAGNLSLSIGQKLDSDSEVSFGLDAARNLPVSYKLGCRFLVFRDFSALASWSSQPGRFAFGTIFSLRSFNLAYALQTHPELDWTHSIGIAAALP